MNEEYIGKVKLNLTHYPGEDKYCDGKVEDEILEIVRNYSPVEYGRIIEERKSWPVLYHLSDQRENIVSWLPFDKSMKVLEIGAGCGAITGALSAKAGRVDCVDLSKKRSTINATRHQFLDNIEIHVGNFQDIEPDLPTDYDYIVLIGVFEYGQSYIGGDTPFHDFLKIINKHRKPEGHIAIAIENKYGMKYFAGCREDHLGSFFSSIENYKDGGGVRTFSHSGLERIIQDVGLSDYHFYYPYPDYKFMTTLYSDSRLPGKGELTNNIRNYDRDRMLLFDESAAFDGIVEDGSFPFFSNSYMVIIGDRPKTTYARYSNDRAREYAITTRIDGNKVIKSALYEEGKEHIRRMKSSYDELTKRYLGSKLYFARCEINEAEEAVFDFVKGRPFSELLDDKLTAGDTDGFLQLIKELAERIEYNGGGNISDMDLVFSNILVDGNKWTAIDYEWVKGRIVPAKEIVYRALYCYTMENPERNITNFDEIMRELDITVHEAEGYREDEASFQKQVTGKLKSMAELREIIGGKLLTKDILLGGAGDDSLSGKVQIYTDTGKGFNEDESYFYDDNYDSDGYIEVKLSLDSDVHRLRIDPCMDYCIAMIDDITFNGSRISLSDRKRVIVNGRLISGGDDSATALFVNDDPCIEIFTKDIVRSTGNEVVLKMHVIHVPKGMSDALLLEVKKRFRL